MNKRQPINNQKNNTNINDIFTSLPGSISWKDLDGNYLGCNNEFAISAGLKNNENIIGLTDYQLPWQESAKIIRSNELNIITTGKHLLIEESLEIANKKNVIWLSRKSPLMDKTGKIIGIICTSFDITEQKTIEKQAQKAMIENVSRQIKEEAKCELEDVKYYYENIISTAPCYLFWKNLNGEYLGYNDAFAAILGIAPKEMIGLTDHDLPFLEYVDFYRNIDAQVIKTGKPIKVEEKVKTVNGEQLVLTTKSPLRNKQGAIIGIIGTAVDITAQKETERLKDELAFTTTLLELSPGHIYAKNLKGELIACNLASATDLGFESIEDILGFTDYDLHPKYADFINSIDTQVIKSGKPIIAEEAGYNAEGKDSIWLSHKKPLRNKEGEIIGIIGVSIDITAQKENERLKDELAFTETLLKLAPEHVYAKDLNGAYLGCNLLHAIDAGFNSIEEVIGLTDYDMPWREYASSLQAVDKKVVESKEQITIEEKVKIADGRNITILSTKKPLRNKDGDIIGIIGTSIDITERKETERLRDELAFTATLLELSPGHIYAKDLQGKYLGCNLLCAIDAGYTSIKETIGHTDYEMPWKDCADILQANDMQVVKTSEPITIEEKSRIGDRDAIMLSYKEPLRNKQGEIIGIIGTSVDITAHKETERLKDELAFTETLLKLSPGYVYAKNLKGEHLVCNLAMAHAAGFTSIEEMIGLTDYDMPWKESADFFRNIDIQVAETGNLFTTEERAKIADGRNVVLQSHKGPLRNKHGEIIGIIGTAVDITDRKAKEQVVVNEQEKFKTIVKQMLHDIQSPLSSLSTIVAEQSVNLRENTRITLRNATDRIGDITNNLLNQYQNKSDCENKTTTLLVSLSILQIMSEKRYQYKDTNVRFSVDFDQVANFAFIQINPTDFKRMLSNLINNAVEALKDKLNGRVSLELVANTKNVVIYVRDNGYGMPKHIRDSFFAGIAITEGKDNGHGVGLMQINHTINTYGGTCKIYVEDGTEIVIKFPIIPTPHWIVSEVKITKDDIVIILDDDESIHGAWDSKFTSILQQFPTITVKHYTQGQDAINYINTLNNEQKQNIVLLTDYELLNQGINGLDVIKHIGSNRTILVTSHASNLKAEELVIKEGIKTLPKELVPVVSILVSKEIPKWSRCVDIVWVEDQKWFVDSIIHDYYSHLAIDIYSDPNSFMEDIHQYPLDTRIILDTYYFTPDNKTAYLLDGFTIAKMLHEMGYSKLILFSGEAIESHLVPEYLTVVLKNDVEAKKILDRI